MNNPYRKAFVICLLIIFFLTCLLRFPTDDGLRHVGLAFGNFSSWGNVYPFSIFEEFKDYNPWFGYDLILRLIAGALKYLPISLLTIKFLLTKSLSFLFLLVFFYLCLSRSSLLDEIKDRDSFTLVLIILVVFLVFPFGRIMIARPFAFGTFFLIYSAGQKGVLRGALSSLALTFFYPYLSWFYIIPVAFAHFIKGDKKFALGAFFFVFIFLLLQPPSFWGFQIALVKSEVVRSAINAKIQEFHSTLKFFPFYIYLAGLIILYPKFSKDLKNLNYLNILILIYLLPALKYIRYFHDITLPLLFISFAKELSQILLEPFQNFVSSWAAIIENRFNKIKSRIRPRPIKNSNKKGRKAAKPDISLKPYIAAVYLLIFVILIHLNFKQVASFRNFQNGLMPIAEGSLVLASFGLQYKTLYLRPDLRLIPSCEMGFAGKGITKEYVNFFNAGLIRPLSRKTNAKYFLESQRMYVNPEDGRFLNLLGKNNNFNLWKILDSKTNSYSRYDKVGKD
jgi:hypothetical protein